MGRHVLIALGIGMDAVLVDEALVHVARTRPAVFDRIDDLGANCLGLSLIKRDKAGTSGLSRARHEIRDDHHDRGLGPVCSDLLEVGRDDAPQPGGVGVIASRVDGDDLGGGVVGMRLCQPARQGSEGCELQVGRILEGVFGVSVGDEAGPALSVEVAGPVQSLGGEAAAALAGAVAFQPDGVAVPDPDGSELGGVSVFDDFAEGDA